MKFLIIKNKNKFLKNKIINSIKNKNKFIKNKFIALLKLKKATKNLKIIKKADFY